MSTGQRYQVVRWSTGWFHVEDLAEPDKCRAQLKTADPKPRRQDVDQHAMAQARAEVAALAASAAVAEPDTEQAQ